MSTNPVRKALFKEGNVPPAGTCISAFVNVTDGQNILLGKVSKPEIWVDRFLVGEDRANYAANSGKYVMPGSHLKWYESPLEAAERILSEQVLLPNLRKGLMLAEVQSWVDGNPNDEENPPHWDICMVYEARIPKALAKKLSKPEWFEDYGMKKKSSLTVEDFARGHGEVLEKAGMIGKKRKAKR
jgi:ADP-ribose pyrophosphatase YjhB (NUDIX family)